jgi:hypothetical protein
MAIKHVGKMKNNGAKVLVVFRTLPGDPYFALVVGTASLDDTYHNAIINVVESQQAQDANELGEILGIRHFPDGKLMLEALHRDGKLVKVPTSDVLMTPDTVNSVPLSELNALIAEQRGVAIDELVNFIGHTNTNSSIEEVAKVNEIPSESPTLPTGDDTAKTTSASVNQTENLALTDKDLAKSYRSQADAMYKEAAKLRKQADELDPPAKKTVKVKETTDA